MLRRSADPAQLEISLDPPTCSTGAPGASGASAPAAVQPLRHLSRPDKPAPRHKRVPGLHNPSNPTNRSLIERYVAERTDLRPLSRVAYTRDLECFASFIEPEDLFHAGTGDVRAWVQHMMHDPGEPDDPQIWSPRTMRRALSSVATFYLWARRRGLASVALDIDMPREPERQAPPAPSHSDIERLFLDIEIQLRQTLDRRRAELLILDAVVLRLCYNLGPRISEASGIQLANISEVDGEVRATLGSIGVAYRDSRRTPRI